MIHRFTAYFVILSRAASFQISNNLRFAFQISVLVLFADFRAPILVQPLCKM